MDIRVSIYERVKKSGKWREKHVPTPRIIKKDGSLFGKDNREGHFLISWYENRKKKRQVVKGRMLSDAVSLARSKAWYLNGRRQQHIVQDPTKTAPRPVIQEQVPLYLEAKSGCGKTLSAHRLALRELMAFAATEKIYYVDEITKPFVRRFYEELLDGGNTPFTAANKVLKVNSFYRAVLRLDPGKGVITKRDYKRELTNTKVPQVYTRQELNALFKAMDASEHLAFSVLNEAALRKKELMFLEDTDLICDQLVPGVFKCELRIESKPSWGHITKTGAHRNVLVSKELMDRLLERKEASRPSRLLFGATTGKPEYHWYERLKEAAKRAGIDPATVWLHKFRATCATNWLWSKELGGKGWDIGFVRQQLGHDDYKSIEAYIAIVKNEEQALREQVAKPNKGKA